MASSSIEPSTNPTSDLATLISKEVVSEDVLKLYAEKGELDIPDKDGRTPLMIACLKGLEDTVEFLLANGANPNSKCIKEGNTPMHYACTVEDLDAKKIFSFSDCGPSSMISKIDIIKCLRSFGAQADQENLDGWTPPCRAALFRLTDVVDIFLEEDDFKLSLEMKIRVTEILGVSQAIVCVMEVYGELDELFYPFSRAIGFQKDATLQKTQVEPSELVDCFKKISLKECHTSEEIKSVQQSELGLKAHAFLVGDRVLSSDLKQKYLYPALASFGHDLMWELGEGSFFDEGLQVLSLAIRFEHRGESELGMVVQSLAHGFDQPVFKDDALSLKYLQSARDLLFKYESVLNHVHIDNLSDHANHILQFLARIVYNEAFHCSTVDMLLSTLEAVEKLVRIIRGRIRRENPDNYHELSSVTFNVMEHLSVEFYVGINVHPRSLHRVMFVLRKTLFYESASYRDRKDGSTLLHVVASCASSHRLLEHLEELAWAFVRHGCPIDAENKAGETARDVLIRKRLYDPERNPRLLSLVSPPTTVPTLEELAIRQILQKDINYLGEVPTRLYGMIRGGLKDSDLERANDETE